MKYHLWVCLIPHTQPLYHIITKTCSLLKQHSAHDIQHHHSTFKCLPQKSSENWNTTLRANYLLILMLNYTNPVHFLGIYSLLLLQSAPVTAKHFMICCMGIWSYIIHHCVVTPTNNLDKETISVKKQLSQLTALHNFQWASKFWESQKLCII
jgi:hypothetical protein